MGQQREYITPTLNLSKYLLMSHYYIELSLTIKQGKHLEASILKKRNCCSALKNETLFCLIYTLEGAHTEVDNLTLYKLNIHLILKTFQIDHL